MGHESITISSRQRRILGLFAARDSARQRPGSQGDLAMNARRTNLLAALLIVASVCAAITFARLQTIAADAIAANDDVRQCEADLVALARGGAAPHVASTAPSQTQLEQMLNDAAITAGTRLSSIEPGQPDR